MVRIATTDVKYFYTFHSLPKYPIKNKLSWLLEMPYRSRRDAAAVVIISGIHLLPLFLSFPLHRS